MLLDRPFDQERVDEHQTVLQQLEAERHDLLLFAAVGGQDPLPAIAEEVIGAHSTFDHIEAFVDLVAQVERREVLTEIDRLLDFAQLGQGFVGRMRDIIGVEALEDRLGGSRAAS